MKSPVLTLILFGSLCSLSVVQAQANMDSIYQENLTKEFINGVYIPKNMTEAFRELVNLAEESGLENFQKAEEDIIARKLHFGLGKWIALKWNFYEGSRFTHCLNELGVSYPDDMIQFTIVSFHRFLNKRPLELDARAKVYEEKRQQTWKSKHDSAKPMQKRKTQVKN